MQRNFENIEKFNGAAAERPHRSGLYAFTLAFAGVAEVISTREKRYAIDKQK